MDKVRVISVVETESLRGNGEYMNPIRTVRSYWTLEGDLLAEYDPKAPGWETVKEMATALYLKARAAALDGKDPWEIIKDPWEIISGAAQEAPDTGEAPS